MIWEFDDRRLLLADAAGLRREFPLPEKYHNYDISGAVPTLLELGRLMLQAEGTEYTEPLNLSIAWPQPDLQ